MKLFVKWDNIRIVISAYLLVFVRKMRSYQSMSQATRWTSKNSNNSCWSLLELVLVMMSSENWREMLLSNHVGYCTMYINLFNPYVLFHSSSYYQILVHRVQDWTDTVSDWNAFASNFYISAQIPASDVKTKMMFLLGDGENKGGYNNKELSIGQKYKIYSRALTQVMSKVEILSIEWLRELKTRQLEKVTWPVAFPNFVRACASFVVHLWSR